MKEKVFNIEVIEFCKGVVTEIKEDKLIKSDSLQHLFIGSSHIYTGSMPWWTERESSWKWQHFKRQVDLVIGISDKIDGETELIPLIAGEVKLSTDVNTAELDKKSAIYGPLRELYALPPFWV